jgi:hypothetical protein
LPGGHLTTHEQPEALAELITSWIDNCHKTPAPRRSRRDARGADGQKVAGVLTTPALRAVGAMGGPSGVSFMTIARHYSAQSRRGRTPAPSSGLEPLLLATTV